MRILVVDDDSDFTTRQCEWLKREGHDAIGVLSECKARESLAEKGEDIDIAFIDMYMEAKDSGLRLVRLIRESFPWIVPIVVTGHADFEGAARCMEEGCFSYIVKGETPPEMIRQTIRKAADYYQFVTTVPRVKYGLNALRGNLAELAKTMEQVSDNLNRIEDELSLLGSSTSNRGQVHH